MVVKESLRKYAPINLFPRLASDEDTLPSGHKVKPGDFILLSSYAMGRNPRVWENPLEFNPDRFTDESLRMQADKQAKASARDDPEKLEIAKERMRRRMAAGRDFTYTPFGGGCEYVCPIIFRSVGNADCHRSCCWASGSKERHCAAA